MIRVHSSVSVCDQKTKRRKSSVCVCLKTASTALDGVVTGHDDAAPLYFSRPWFRAAGPWSMTR